MDLLQVQEDSKRLLDEPSDMFGCIYLNSSQKVLTLFWSGELGKETPNVNILTSLITHTLERRMSTYLYVRLV